jgi:hypothetical protein
MNFVQRTFASLRHQGLGGTMLKLFGSLFERTFDRKYDTDTCARSRLDNLTIQSGNKSRGTRYEPTRVMPLRKLFPVLRKLMPAESVLVDLGSGKGRVLLLASQWGFRELRGIEFAQELCEIARKNIAHYRERTGVRAGFEIIHGDVTTYAIRPEENVFFMFNPFDEVIFAKVLANLSASLNAHPRKILLVICLPSAEFRAALDGRREFAPLRELRCWGYDFSIYSNRA